MREVLKIAQNIQFLSQNKLGSACRYRASRGAHTHIHRWRASACAHVCKYTHLHTHFQMPMHVGCPEHHPPCVLHPVSASQLCPPNLGPPHSTHVCTYGGGVASSCIWTWGVVALATGVPGCSRGRDGCSQEITPSVVQDKQKLHSTGTSYDAIYVQAVDHSLYKQVF